MINKLKNIKKLLINIPVVEIKYKFNNKVKNIYASLEWFSLTGSIKDRVAYQIYYDAIKQKLLKKGDNIVEVTSGNMGLSLTAIGRLLGLNVTIIMPKNMSIERQKLLKLYGANLVLTEDFKSAFNLCEQYKNKGYFCSNQFANLSNKKAHKLFTAQNIYQKIKNKKVNCFVAGVGTSGTLSGAGEFFKHKKFTVYGVEPKNARILSGTPPYKKHQLQGLSDEKTPELYNKKLIDGVFQISDNDAIAMSQKLCNQLALGVGISSGANFLGAVLSGKNCVTVFADDNKKYLSTNLSKQSKSKLVDQIELINVRVIN